MNVSRKRTGAIALIALLVLSAVGPGLVAAATLNFSADKAPLRYIEEDSVTIAEHDMADMSKALEYEDDDGEVATLPAEVNATKKAPIGVSVEKIDDLDYRTFPRISDESGNSVNWTVGSEWTTSSSASGSMSVSETNPAGTAEALTFTATAGASDHGNATYSNFTVDTDATKRVGQVGMNVDSLAAGSNVTVRFQESDGDYVALEVNQSADADADGVIANATGEGWVEQQRLGSSNMSVEGTGDGTLSSIDKVVVHVTGGDATVEIFWLDGERKGEVELGTHYTDSDDDDTLREETETLTDKNFAGEVRMASLDELGSVFDTATLFDKTVYDVQYRAEHVPADDRSISYTDASDYPSYAEILEGHYRITVPTAIDLTHGSLSLVAEQRVPESRYITTEYAIDTGSTSFENASYTAFSGWGSVDDKHTVSNSVSAGDKVIWHDEILYTETELEALKSSGAAGGPVGSGSGGIFGGLLSFLGTLPGMIVGGVVGFLGLRRIFGGS